MIPRKIVNGDTKGAAMDAMFKQAEETFQRLKSQLRSGEVSRREFLDELKKLQLKDDQGRLWMIGSQSGKWYYLKGKDWVQSEPPAAKENKAVCAYCGFENKSQATICARCGGGIGEYADICPKCGSKLVPPLYECPECGKQETAPRLVQDTATLPMRRTERMIFVARGLKALSFLFFGGTLGLLAGILIGAFVGATSAWPGVVGALPSFFLESQGKLIGAIVFSASFGIFGFIALGAFFFAGALLINLILSLTGGLKLTLSVEDVKPEIPKEKPKDKDKEARLDL
jgi:hypothetical protein